METMPNNIKIGVALGFLGGVISIAFMAIFFKPEEIAIAEEGVCLLIAVMFFALAGGFAKGGQWSWDMMMLMTFLTTGVIVCSVIVKLLNVYAGVMLVAICALIVVVLSMTASKTWMNRMRI